MEYTRVSKYAKLEAEHKELRKQYDALYNNVAMPIRSSITSSPHPLALRLQFPNPASHQMMKI